MPRARKARTRPTRRGAPRARTTPPTPPSQPAGPRRLELREPPHAHAVCRRCGRIVEVAVSPFDGEQLRGLATEGPEGWAFDGISLSLTGVCPRCLAGLPPA